MYDTCIFLSLLINSTVSEGINLFVRQQTIVCNVFSFHYDLQTIKIGDKPILVLSIVPPKIGIEEISKESTPIQFYS